MLLIQLQWVDNVCPINSEGGLAIEMVEEKLDELKNENISTILMNKIVSSFSSCSIWLSKFLSVQSALSSYMAEWNSDPREWFNGFLVQLDFVHSCGSGCFNYTDPICLVWFGVRTILVVVVVHCNYYHYRDRVGLKKVNPKPVHTENFFFKHKKKLDQNQSKNTRFV